MRKWLVFGVVFLIGGFLVYNYIYKEHRNIEKEEPSFIVSSADLIDEFLVNNTIASEKYLDKTIRLKGIVTSVEKNIMVVESAISCYFKDTLDSSQLLNSKIEIKGRCIGYDELLEEIKIDQCIILTKSY